MTTPANMILYANGIRIIAESLEKTQEERAKDGKEYIDKYASGIEHIKHLDIASRITFFGGLFLFLVFAAATVLLP